MKQEVLKRKLSAFLHDPVDKPFILMKRSHTERAQELSTKLRVRISEEDATGADWIASAMDRLVMPKEGRNRPEFQVRFHDFPCVIHPLSGEALPIENLPDFDQITQSVNKTFEEISKLNLNDEQLYLFLWRKLIELLKEEIDQKWIWDLAPADTRVPDHTIWDHLKVVCSCSTASYVDRENENVLYNQLSMFLFTIGPVQKFIQCSRKTQDLWLASYILSYLNWVAISTVIEDYGPDSIKFPDLNGQPFADRWLIEKGIPVKVGNLKTPTIPNRFLAILPKDDISHIGERAESAVKQELRNIAEFVFSKFPSEWHTPYAKSILDRQINNFLEIFWIGLPWYSSEPKRSDWEIAIEELEKLLSSEETDRYRKLLVLLKDKGEYPPNIGTLYGLLYSIVERSLGSIKSVRRFSQVEEHSRKCSLCGEREIIRTDKNTSVKDSMKLWDELRKGYPGLLAEGEALCAVCLVKRAGDLYFEDKFGLEVSFPSTSEVSTSTFKDQLLKDDELKQDYEKFTSKLEEIGLPTIYTIPKLAEKRDVDGEWLYAENLTIKYFEKEYSRSINEDDVRELSQLQEQLLRNAKDKLGIKPQKYYAIITMDGDNMGKWISGALLPKLGETIHPKISENVRLIYGNMLDEKALIKPAVHAFISSALREYSLTMVPEIIEKRHFGKVVYAGGDDLLAMVALDSLLEVMMELRAAFSGHIDEAFNVDFTRTSNSGFIKGEDGYLLTMGSKASASMGVAIVHYKMPLREALSWSRQMQELAKSVEGKDAFAIALVRRSGSIRKCVHKWHYNNGKINTISLASTLGSILKDGLSDKFIYNLREEFSKLVDDDGKLSVHPEALKSELKRLIGRASKEGMKNRNVAFAEELFEFFSYAEEQNFDNFINFLDVVNAIAKGVSDRD